jgi:cytochrome c-type biogenesis protein CcmE
MSTPSSFPDPSPSPGTFPEPRTHSRRSKGPVIALASVLVVAFGWLIWGGLDKNVVFFLEPHELLSKGTDGMDVPVRLGGLVKAGSVKWNAETRDLRFEVTDTTSKVITVKSTGAPPQMFRDSMGVILEGKLGRDGVFAATSLIIKHSNEYRAPKEGERPREMFKSIMKSTTE